MITATTVVALILSSCDQSSTVEPQVISEVEDFTYSKSMSVSDADGNRADFEFWTHDESLLAEFEASDFELITMDYPFSTTPTEEVSTGETSAEEWPHNPNEVLIRLMDFKVSEDVTLISVRLKQEALTRMLRWDIIATSENDDDDIIGAAAIYTQESCADERFRFKVQKKTANSNLFWQLLAETVLFVPGDPADGDQFAYIGNTSWTKWRYRGDYEKGCRRGGRSNAITGFIVR